MDGERTGTISMPPVPVPLLDRIGEKQSEQVLRPTETKGRIRNRPRKGKERAVEGEAVEESEEEKRIYTPWCDGLNLPVDLKREVA